jgi:hypothetical protein
MMFPPTSFFTSVAMFRWVAWLPQNGYRPRNPQLSDYYRCVEDNFDGLVKSPKTVIPAKAGIHK